MKTLEELKSAGEAPEWMEETGYKTLINGYLLPGETPRGAWKRVSEAAAARLSDEKLASKFFDLMWKNWLGLATPVFANMGTERGLPISCYSIHAADQTVDIFEKNTELAMLSKYGGGVGIYLGDVRGRGAKITSGGKSDGIVSWSKVYDSTVVAVNQAGVRRGAAAVYLPVEHPDFKEFLDMRRPQGDPNRQCLNLHAGAVLTNEFMNKVENGDKEARNTLREIYKTRLETGEPYCLFIDNTNSQNPQMYKDLDLKVSTSNICSEIVLYTDPEHSFVCCLSSMNLARWEEWKDTDSVFYATLFLDGVMEEFIQKAKKLPYMENAVRFAEKGRPLGLGAMGWHSLLQEKRLGFGDLLSMTLNRAIFGKMHSESLRASQWLAERYGEPEWCKGYGVRNTHRLAIAPTVSNSTISGNISAGIEPLPSNVFTKKSAKGTFIEKNKHLIKLLDFIGKNTDEVWNLIVKNEGSVAQLPFLSQDDKEIFKTAYEIDQMVIIDQAAQRQKHICQAQSLNLFFSDKVDPKYFHEIHMSAWRKGLKSLYYTRTSSVLKADLSSREHCRACEG